MGDVPQTNLLKHINDSLPSYPRAFKQLASLVLSKTFAVSSMSIEELATEAQVSVATVNRFAHECGFNGYPLFRMALRSIFEKIFEPEKKLRSGLLQQFEESEVVNASFASLLVNLENSQNNLSPQTLKKAIDLILEAKNIYIAGMGISVLHASFMVAALEPFLGNNVHELNSFGGIERALRQVSMLGSNDLLIAITLPRYSKSIVDLTLVAREKNIKILALTDVLMSPLVSLSNVTLLASSNHPILYASSAALIALIEGLSAAIALKVSHSAELIAKQTESILPYLYLPTDA